jgi:hypothetical protein
MKKPLFLFILSVLITFTSSSFTVLSKDEPTIIFSDTTSNISSSPAPEKHTGFFGRIKDKLVSVVVKRQPGTAQNGDKKTKLGRIAGGLILLGVGLCLLTGNLLTLLPAIAGVIVGVKAMSIKRERPVVKKEKKVKKNTWARRNLGLLIGVGVAIGVAVAVFLVLGSFNPH